MPTCAFRRRWRSARSRGPEADRGADRGARRSRTSTCGSTRSRRSASSAPPAARRTAGAIAESRDFFLAFPALEALVADQRSGGRAAARAAARATSCVGDQAAEALGQIGDEDAVAPLVGVARSAARVAGERRRRAGRDPSPLRRDVQRRRRAHRGAGPRDRFRRPARSV